MTSFAGVSNKLISGKSAEHLYDVVVQDTLIGGVGENTDDNQEDYVAGGKEYQ